MPNVQGFVSQYAPVAAQVGQRIGVAPDVLLGQWGLETGWGKSIIPGTNNLGNIKGPGVAATDNQTGSNDQYRAYASPTDFGNDFANLIANRYAPAMGAGSNANAFGSALQSGGYAEDPGYANKLSSAVGMVRKFGDAIASALSGSANAAELPAASSAPVISATGQTIMPQTQPSAPVQQATPAPTGDPLLDMAHSVIAGKPAPTQLATSAPSGQAADDPLLAMANSVMAAKPTAPRAAPAAAPKIAPQGPHEETPLDTLGAAVEPLLTAGTSMIAAPVGGAVRLGSALLGNSFQGAQQAGNKVTQALTYQPQTQGGQEALAGLGNLAASAKNAVMSSPVGPLISSIGDAYNKEFVNNQNPLMATVNSMVPGATAGIVLPAAGKIAGSVVDGTAANKLRAAVSGAPAIAPDSIPFGVNTRPGAPAANPLADAAGAKPNYRPNGDGTFTEAPRASAPPTGAAPQAPAPGGATPAPQAGAPSTAPAGQVSTPTPIPAFVPPELPAPKTVLSPDAQAANIATLKAIGLDSQRQSAITGDKFTAGQEYQHSKLDSPIGDTMRAQLATEQGALKNYAQGIVQSTGATANAPEAVGQAIRAPLQGLSSYYDDAVSNLYKTADQRAGGIAAVDPVNFGTLLSTNSAFAGKAENTALRRGINAYAREQGMVGPDGTLQPITVQTAEGMRQYLNSQWSPQNSGLIGKIKDSLDTDVTKAGGDDVYAAARALHAERKNTLDNPNGISSLLNESGPDGINKTVPDEKVAAKVISMPTQQLSHVVATLNALPDSLAPQGQQAIAEIKGAIANKIYQAGDSGGTQNGPSVWNAANVTKQLNAQRSKMGLVFSPDEITKFQTLNDAGHILQTPSAYPGAAVQGHNLLQRGMLMAPSVIGGALGGHLAGFEGASIGSALGGGVSVKMAKAAELANANKLKAAMANPKVTYPK